MLSNDELMVKIEDVVTDYHGDITDLYTAVGMVVVGRMFGWKVMRLVSSRKIWKIANDLFGDIKEPGYLMRERGELASRSRGLEVADIFGGYWDYVKGIKFMPLDQKREVL